MQRSRKILIGIAAVALVAFLTAWALGSSKPAVSLTVAGFVATNHWEDYNDSKRGGTSVTALIALTNNTRKPLMNWSVGAQSVLYWVLYRTDSGWDKFPTVWGTPNVTRHTLLPGEGITFYASLKTGKQCKVAIQYGHVPNPIWQKLPLWILSRLPSANPWKTATTDVIDLRGPQQSNQATKL